MPPQCRTIALFVKVNLAGGYFDSKSSIFGEGDVLLLSVNYNEFACGQKEVRCVSMA
jgi:hypothetical protein